MTAKRARGPMSNKQESVEEVLVRARALIEDGWTQGTFVRSTVNDNYEFEDRYCALGAIRTASGTSVHDRNRQAERALLAATESYFIRPARIERWNDALWRTRRSVLLAFDRAIETEQVWKPLFGKRPSYFVRRAYRHAVRDTERAFVREHDDAFVARIAAIPRVDNAVRYVPHGPAPISERPTGPRPKVHA